MYKCFAFMHKCVPIGSPEWEAMDGCEYVVLIVEPRSSAKGTEAFIILVLSSPYISFSEKQTTKTSPTIKPLYYLSYKK